MRGGVRRYGEAEVRRLRFIRQAQAAGFTLEEIGELLSLDAGQDHARARELATARIGELDRRIEALQSARAALSRLADACARTGGGPCPIIASFDTAAVDRNADPPRKRKASGPARRLQE